MSRRRRILFLDRDGTLIEEPADEQVDRLDKLRLVPGVIPALLCLRDAGYEFVMVTNQDGLGTESFPRAQFEAPQALLLQILESQGIRFAAIHVDPHFAHQQAPTRKPGIGMVLDYLRAGEDMVFYPRPGAPEQPYHRHNLAEGDPLDSQEFPVVWPRPFPNFRLAEYYAVPEN